MKSVDTRPDVEKATAEIVSKLKAMPNAKHFWLGVGVLLLVEVGFVFSVIH